MRSAKSIGRVIGLMFLAQSLLAPVVYFRLMRPVTAPGFLANAAGSSLRVRVAILFTFVLGALTLAIAVAAMPVFRRYSERMALAFLALSIVGLATLAVESIAIRTMLSLSQEYAKAGAANELFQTLGGIARSTWHGAHYTNLMVAHGTVFVLYGILFRFALVPRALAAFGMAATLLSITAVAMPLLGYRFAFLMLLPTALSHLALIPWLIVRGFGERQHLLRGDVERVELARS
jgi:uncharacterized protein DUF4386